MTMISYAQNHEDVLLQRAFSAGHVGFYIDVGAADPVIHSVTRHFYDHGWHGINVEPLPTCFRRLQEDRPRDMNLNMGMSNTPGQFTFYEMPSCQGWSTFSQTRADAIRASGGVLVEHKLPVSTLADICAKYVSQPIDFLKIDVECHEKAVLEGADWKQWRPRVVLLEAPEPDGPEAPHSQWESILLGNDYLFATFDGLNRYYIRAEDRALVPSLRVPVNVLDDFVSHNLGATQQALRETQEGLQTALQSWQETEGRYQAAVQERARVEQQLHDLVTRYGPAIRLAQKVERALKRTAGPFPAGDEIVSLRASQGCLSVDALSEGVPAMHTTETERDWQLRGALAVAQAELLEAQTLTLRLERRVVQWQRDHATALQVIEAENRALHAGLVQENAHLHAALASAVSSRWWRLGHKVRGVLRRVKRALRV